MSLIIEYAVDLGYLKNSPLNKWDTNKYIGGSTLYWNFSHSMTVIVILASYYGVFSGHSSPA
jgi:hypothetical protein